MKKKVVIIGGVAGGATAATRLRRLDEELEIIMFEKGEFISFANCGLPYHIGEVIKNRDNLLVTTKEALKSRFKIDARNFSEVTKVNFEDKKVEVNSKDRGRYEESFDYLIISPGAKPVKPAIKGIDSEKIYSLRNINDMDKIKAVVDKGAENAVVIGGGFIGIEVAENLKHRGLNVTLIENSPHILAPLDTEISMIVEKEMRDRGITLNLTDGVSEFRDEDSQIITVTNSGKEFKSDFVVSAIGVQADTGFLRDTELKLNEKGFIVTDDHLRTNIENVYAAGDAIEVRHYVDQEKTTIALAGPANRQGRMIADNIYGMNKSYKGSLGTSIIKVFDLTAASTGYNERTLIKKNVAYKAFYAHPQSHASYYPGAKQMTVKVLTDESGKILGAQAVGYEGIDKFIDTMATVIHFKGNVSDLTELDLAYAPPYLTAKSPANVIGFIGINHFDGIVKYKTYSELEEEFDKEKDVLLDVREATEVENGALENIINIPLDSLRDRLSELDKEKTYWIYCQIGLRGYIASRILTQNGFKNFNLSGGYRLHSLGKVMDEISENDDKNDENDSKKDSFKDASKENSKSKEAESEDNNDLKEAKFINVDACGLSCPGPLLKVKEASDSLKEGEVLNITASDPGFYEDIKAFSRRSGLDILSLENKKGIISASLKKKAVNSKNLPNENMVIDNGEKNKTIVVFSGDLDKAIASFIIANGAKAMGGKVTMFFTFWGINILRKKESASISKNFIEKMFGMMMPKGSEKLAMSKMNMAGIGPRMIRGIMKKKNVDSLELLMKKAIDNGVELVACQMSMDLLGFKREELLDEVKLGGVGYYLGEAEESKINLFI